MHTLGHKLEATQPDVVRWFRSALTQQQLAHGYVLQSATMAPAYALVVDVAKALNCETATQPGQFCDTCRSCQWLNDNAHPHLFTVSRLTYETDEDSKRTSARKQISTDQVQQLIQQVSLSQKGYRVVVFTDVEVVADSTPVGWLPPYSWRAQNEGKSLALAPLTRQLLNEKSANQFLKTLEEPPGKVLFFFLTNSEANLLETVVSRCQIVRFKANDEGPPVPESLLQGFADWFATVRKETPLIEGASRLEACLTTVEGASTAQAVLWLQHWLRQLSRHQQLPLSAYHAMQQALQQAIERLQANVNASAVLLETQAKLRQAWLTA